MKSTLGQIAYEAYCEARNWKGFDDSPLPTWNSQRPDLKKAWEAAALAVAGACGH